MKLVQVGAQIVAFDARHSVAVEYLRRSADGGRDCLTTAVMIAMLFMYAMAAAAASTAAGVVE